MYIYIYMYICICICIYIYTYVYIYIQTHTQTRISRVGNVDPLQWLLRRIFSPLRTIVSYCGLSGSVAAQNQLLILLVWRPQW